MMKELWSGRKLSGLVYDALQEVYGMLEREEGMFGSACDALMSDRPPAVDVVHEDEDINVGERMVRRMVVEHLTLNPDRDLPTSLVLISIVQDVERIGDYTKSLLELSRWRSVISAEEGHAGMCREIRKMIEPMFGITLRALRESDPELARETMRRHREVKGRTDALLEAVMQDADSGREAVVCSIASRFLRRVSAHLSNIASSIAIPFDQLGGDDES